MKKIYVLLFLILLLCAGTYIWWNQAVKPTDPSDKESISFTVKKGENVRSIADRLQKQGILRSPVAFFLLARFGGLADSIQAGSFRLSPSMDLFTLSQNLTHGTEDLKVTFIEGWRNEEVAMTLTKELNIPETSFLKKAKIGYIFPDTYLIPKESSEDAVIKIVTDNFNRKITPEILRKAKESGLSLNDLIIISSMVEREAKYDKDRPLVASVILNRLNMGMKLDIDATVQYALGYQPAEKSWWKKQLTQEDLAVDSPYNTYKNAGLPPTAIANPGLAVINAVVNAPKTNYLYYLSDEKGNTYFSSTFDEHSEKISTYLNR